MKKSKTIPPTQFTVLTMAELKAVTAAFNRGETNVFDALMRSSWPSRRIVQPLRAEGRPRRPTTLVETGRPIRMG